MEPLKSIPITREVTRTETVEFPVEENAGLKYAVVKERMFDDTGLVVALFDFDQWAQDFIRGRSHPELFRIIDIETGETV